MGTIWRDLAYTARTLRKSPGFTAVVIFILALGIGANTAIFSVVDAVVVQPLPYPSPDRLVMLPAAHRPNEMGNEVAVAKFVDWRRESRSFEQLGAYGPFSMDLTGVGTPERLRAARMTPSAFTLLGVKPLAGRLFSPDEETRNSRVVILSYGLWQSHFGGDKEIVGKTVRLGGAEYPVVGIMPADFHFPTNDVQIWVPVRITEARARDRKDRWMYVLGRLKPGVSRAAAQHEMDVLSNGLSQQFPETDKDWGTRLVPLQEYFVGRVRPALLILLATVFAVLLLACANIANLQLARASGRRTEMALRSALGAPAAAILRQLLSEGLALSGLGALLGLLFAHWGLRLLLAVSPSYIPRLDEVRIDLRVLLFTLVLSLLTGVVFGLVPAISALQPDLVSDLSEAGRDSSSGVARLRLRRLLTITEVAAALVLVVGAGLLVSSLGRLQEVRPGFKPSGVVTMELVLSPVRYFSEAQRGAFFHQLAQRVATLPGVLAVGGISNLPLSGSNSTESYRVEGQAPADSQSYPEAGYQGVTAGYFAALGIPLLQGRTFSAQDAGTTQKVVVVNKALADQYWPQGSALGRRIYLMGGSRGDDPHTIVGVVGNVHHSRLDLPAVPEIYVSTEQHAPWDSTFLVVRGKGRPEGLGPALRNEVTSLDPEQPVSKLKTMEQVIADSTSEARFYAALVSAFAVLALVLSCLGIYSIISYSVAERRHEIGIRMALGARRESVVSLVVAEGMTLAAIGIAAGLLLAAFATRSLQSLLFGIEASDPRIFAGTALLLGAVALAATLIPAFRASKLSPMIAFRL